MKKEELVDKGNEAIRKALEDAILIINSKGHALSKKRHSDEMFFSPKLDCTDDLSTIIFGDEFGANDVIDNILKPQDDGDNYFAIKITKFDTEVDGEPITVEYSSDGEEPTEEDDLDDADDILAMIDDKENSGKKEKDDEEG